MGLYFHSNYPKATLSLSVMLPDHSCSGGYFRKQGWWTIPYGHTVEVVSGDLSKISSYYYYYVQGKDGSFWAGPYNTLVSNSKFSQCYSNDKGMTRNIGYRELVTGSHKSFTVNLIP